MNVETQQIGSYSEITGLWQFQDVAGNYLAVLEKDDAEGQSKITVLRLQDAGWSAIRTIVSDDMSIRAIDGHAIDTKLYVCTELNGSEALQLVSAEVAQLVDPEVAQVPFTPLGDLSLSAELVERVDLPVDRWWNTIRPLALGAWLFGPSFVKGGLSMPVVVAATADGQIVALGRSGEESRSELLGVSRALDPQAAVVNRVRHVAVKRIAGDVYPFWMLPRYSGSGKVVNGELVVRSGDGPEQDLSATLGIGPIFQHAAAVDRAGGVWLFALQEAPVGTDVLAIALGEGGWVLRDRRSLDLEVTELSVAPSATGWQLVYGVDADGSWTLYHQSWRIAP
ncbi:MAG TPA: hypothetical protein VLC48_06540 [Gemmatimonadota bacterium]|nr:hypothetical protein [Gemmatimonadota bacterium]